MRAAGAIDQILGSPQHRRGCLQRRQAWVAREVDQAELRQAPGPHQRRLGDDLGRYTEHALSLSLGHDLAGGWAGYWETYGFMPKGRPGTTAWTVNTGITHGIGGNAQAWDQRQAKQADRRELGPR